MDDLDEEARRPQPRRDSMSNWRDIETAPKDGTAILASGLNHGKGPSRHYSVVEWMDFGCESGWYPDEDSSPLIYLTHWMPLPQPPEDAR